MPSKKHKTKASQKTKPAATKPATKPQAKAQATAKEAAAKPSPKPVSARKLGTATKATARPKPSSTPEAGSPDQTLLALTSAGLSALRADLEAGSPQPNKRGRAASTRKTDKPLAAALERLEADYARLLR